ncbi:hypothetical protein M407DRAFT_29300 [Tulasnella calospora MUT 4182]|uniref:Uncharacterized protein n=1 Tax=Tulasnella calospora MUT 4182 TaxID=1051891 RepID=A0A0C3PZS1_9AGAM|nr:hypothetical protein M407DRAFT_29300 [Tulasnella calospora MUT 4182]
MTSTGSALDIVFSGRDGNECEAFIAAIEELAFTEGWSEDEKRMFLFARSRLRQGALRWFARLDPSKKKDWDLFVEALFEQYPPAEAPTEAEISTPVWSATTFSPSASTAILPSDLTLDSQPNIQGEIQVTGRTMRPTTFSGGNAYDPSIPGRRIGLLRIAVENETTGPQYVWWGRSPIYSAPYHSYGSGGLKVDLDDQLRTTIDRHEALVVCFIPSQEPYPIGCLNAKSTHGDLCLQYNPIGTSVGELRLGYEVVAFDKRKNTHPPGAPKKVLKVWNVLSDGSLEASLSGPFDLTAHPLVTQKLTCFLANIQIPIHRGNAQSLIAIRTTLKVVISGRRISRLQWCILIPRESQSAL